MSDTINARGAIVASGEKKETVTIRSPVVGEDSKVLQAGQVVSVSAPFAQNLIRRKKAYAGDKSKEAAAEKAAAAKRAEEAAAAAAAAGKK